MNYNEVYHSLINTRKNLNRSKDSGIYEKHHIIPRCMGGDDSPRNLILLTPREHFIAHILLYKANKNTEFEIKLGHAASSFMCKNYDEKKISSKQYEICKKILVETKKKLIGELNSFFGKHHTEETKKYMREFWIGKTYIDRYGEEKANEIKKKISEKTKGKPAKNKGKKMNISETGLQNILKRNDKLSKMYLVTRPNGEKLIIRGIPRFCNIENQMFGLNLIPTSLKNMLTSKTRKMSTYKGYIIEQLPEDFTLTQSAYALHPSVDPLSFEE
jgi:hypothetical protein